MSTVFKGNTSKSRQYIDLVVDGSEIDWSEHSSIIETNVNKQFILKCGIWETVKKQMPFESNNINNDNYKGSILIDLKKKNVETLKIQGSFRIQMLKNGKINLFAINGCYKKKNYEDIFITQLIVEKNPIISVVVANYDVKNVILNDEFQ